MVSSISTHSLVSYLNFVSRTNSSDKLVSPSSMDKTIDQTAQDTISRLVDYAHQIVKNCLREKCYSDPSIQSLISAFYNRNFHPNPEKSLVARKIACEAFIRFIYTNGFHHLPLKYLQREVIHSAKAAFEAGVSLQQYQRTLNWVMEFAKYGDPGPDLSFFESEASSLPLCFRDKEMVRILAGVIPARVWSYICSTYKPNWTNDRDTMLEIVKNTGSALRFAKWQLKMDKELVLAAVRNQGTALEHAHENLKMDIEVVNIAIRQDGKALQYASEDFRRDKNLALVAIENGCCDLRNVHENLRGDRDIVLALVKKNGWNLQYAHEDLKRDREVVLAAAQMDGDAIDYANEDFLRDKEIVLACLSSTLASGGVGGLQASSLDPCLLKDRDVQIALAKLRRLPESLWYEGWRSDLEFTLAHIQSNPSLFHRFTSYWEQGWQGDKNLMLRLVSIHGHFLKEADDNLKKNREVVLAAVKRNAGALVYAHSDLRADADIVLEALKEKPSAQVFSCISQVLLQDRDFILRIAANAAKALPYFPSHFKEDKEIICTAIQSDWQVWEEIGGFQSDTDVLLTLCLRWPREGYLILSSMLEDEEQTWHWQRDKSFALAISNCANTCTSDTGLMFCNSSEKSLYFFLFSEELKNDPEVKRAYFPGRF